MHDRVGAVNKSRSKVEGSRTAYTACTQGKNGEWKMEDGRWKIEDGGWKMEKIYPREKNKGKGERTGE